VYNIPIAPYSIAISDIDNDGENDLIFGHNFSQITQWSGISILQNTTGYFNLLDSIYLYGWQPDCQALNLNQFPTSEIIGKKEDPNLQNEFLAIIYDMNFSNINYFSLNTYQGVDNIAVGNIDDTNNMDVIVSSYSAKFWGFLLNDGQGNFSSPIYFNLNYSPTDIKSGKLNEDNYDDIVIGGADLTIKFSTGTGFQTLTFEEAAVDIVIVDLDNDGDNDVIGFDDLYFGTEVTFFENTGNSTFFQHENWEFTPGCYYMTVSDFNNDSLPDLFFHTNADNGMYFFYNLGEFEFDSPVYFSFTNYGESSRRSASADFDNNGYNDLVIVRSYGAQLPVGNVTILFNDGNGNFVEDPITGAEIPKQKNKKSNLKCYPNPFTTETTIEINIKENEFAELSVYNLSGKKVKTITYKTTKGGITKIKWDGLDNGDKPCKPGPYLLTLKVNGSVLQTIKLIKY
jgi:hypothetical protein